MKIKKINPTYIEVQPQQEVKPLSFQKRACAKVCGIFSAIFNVATSAPALRFVSLACLFAVMPADFSCAWFLAHAAVAGCDEYTRRGVENVRKEALKVALPSMFGTPFTLMNKTLSQSLRPFVTNSSCVVPLTLGYNEAVALGVGVFLGFAALVKEKIQREKEHVIAFI